MSLQLEQEQLEIARNRFVDKWASARQEQLIYSTTMRSELFQKDIRHQQLEVECGLRAVRQTNDFYDWQLAKVQADIDDWKDRFEREKEIVDSRLHTARTEKRLWVELKEEMKEITKEITELEQLELDFIKEDEHKRLCEKYAVQLQAWWRGVMVRKGFGPFRKGKKSKGKKKAKGSKSKNKKTVRTKK